MINTFISPHRSSISPKTRPLTIDTSFTIPILPHSSTSCTPTTDLEISRHITPSPMQPIQYPLSLRSRFTSTLRPRRRSIFLSLLRRRIIHILLALSIPILGLLLVGEIQSQSRWGISLEDGDLGMRGRNLDLKVMRGEFERKRRREIEVDKKGRKRGLSVEGGGGVREWSLEDEVGLREEVEGWWPDWWGCSDERGRSPWDHTPKRMGSEAGKKRVLFLTDYVDYLERMNTHTYEIIDAALRHPHIITDVWGPNWAGYDRSISLSRNVKRRAKRIAQIEEDENRHTMRQRDRRKEYERLNRKRSWRRFILESGSVADEEDFVEEDWERPEWEHQVEETEECGEVGFDIVWTISDIFKQDDPHVTALECGALLVQQLGDCHEMRCTREWYPQANNITLSKYAFELPEIFHHARVKRDFPSWEMGLFGHSPDTANEWDFHPIPFSQKIHKAKMFGFDGSFYPLRTTITNHLHDNPESDSPISRHDHPGYNVDVDEKWRRDPLETYEAGHEIYARHRLLREDFAKGMRDSWVCVFDSSLERKMIRKYAQALLSGCVIAADIPTEHEEALGGFVIPLKPTWDIEKIHEVLNGYLDDPERLQQMAMDGFAYARKHLTSTAKISHVLSMAEAFNQGVRGYEFFHRGVDPTGQEKHINHPGAPKKAPLAWNNKHRPALARATYPNHPQ